MSHALPWSEQEDATLIRLHRADVRFPDIGRELNRTAGACSMRLSTLRQGGRSIQNRAKGVRTERPEQPWSAPEKGRLADLHRSGMPLKRIAGALGRSQEACKKQIKELRHKGADIPLRTSPVRRPPESTSASEEREDRASAALSCDKHLLDLLRSGRRHWVTIEGARA